MTIFITPLFYLATGIVAAFISYSFYLSYRRFQSAAAPYLFFTFLFLSLHSLSLSLPALLVPNRPVVIGGGFIVGMIFFFLLLFSAFRLQTSLNHGFYQRHSFIILTILIGIGLTVVGIEIVDFRLPAFGKWGTLFWNVHPGAAWLTGTTSLVYGLVWADFFQQTGRMARGLRERVKMYLLSFDGIMLGLAGLLLFTSHNAFLTIIGHSLFLLACLASAVILFLDGRD